jgi:hypothetical protein
MAVLQSRLDQLEIARQAQMNAEHTQSLNEISWGNQIRSYVLHVSFPFKIPLRPLSSIVCVLSVPFKLLVYRVNLSISVLFPYSYQDF